MTHQYRFDDLLIDQMSFRLVQAGKPLAVEPKALHVLIFLVQHQGRLIERRELLSAVWGDAFVTDHVLNRSIGQLRKVLGDDAKEPRYIETVPTLGYRFIAAVETETVETQVASTETAVEAGSVLDVRTSTELLPVGGRVGGPVGVARRPGVRLLALVVCLGLIAVLWFWVRHGRQPVEGPIRSLAVLPLDDLSPGTREDYFADGMTDELITELARIPGLRVVSRTSVMQNKGSRKPLSRIAQELKVDALVEGSVVRSGDRVRITAQLIDTRSDRHLWAQSFEGPLGDILSLQDSVAREIAVQTSAILTPAARAELTAARHLDPAAHDAYLRGLYFIQRREGALAASYFRQAIALEPEYGDANAGLAEALVTQVISNGDAAPALMPPAIAAAKRAIALDPYSGEAYTALGAIDANYLWSWSDAERNLRKGVELSPSSSGAELWLAIYLTSVSRPSEAVEVMRRAVALDPFSFWANRLLGSTLYYSRHYDESLVALNRALEIAPDKGALVEGWYSGNYELQGRYGDALAADIKDLGSELSAGDIKEFRSAFEHGGWKRYQEARVKFLLPRSTQECQMNPIALSYVRLGNLTEAFRWFNRDLDHLCGKTVFDLASDPRLDAMRADARFAVLLRRVNLPH